LKSTFKRNTNAGKDSEKIRKRPEKTGKEIFTVLQEQIINKISNSNTVTTLQLAEILNVNSRTVEKNIRSLRESGMLQRKGGRKQGYWIVNVNAGKESEKGSRGER